MIQISLAGKTFEIGRGETPLSLVYAISDSDDLSKIVGYRSKQSITLTATKDIQEAVDGFDELGLQTETINSFIPQYIKSRGVPIFSGRAELFEAITKAGIYSKAADEYKAAFYGSNSVWFGLLNDVQVSDMDFQTFLLDVPNVLAFGNAAYDNGNDICLTVVKWKDWTTPTEVLPEEHTVGLFLRSIIDKAFASIGYTIESEFMDTDEFKSLILPIPMYYPEDADPLTESRATGRVAQTFGSSVVDLQSIIDDPDGNIDLVNDRYVAPFAGVVAVAINDIFGFNLNYTVRVNGSAATQIGAMGDFMYYQVAANDNVDILATYSGTGIISGVGSPWPAFKMIPFVQQGSTQYPSLMIPKGWNVKDLIKDISTIFNLRWDTNNGERIITVEPAFDYKTLWNGVSELKKGFYSRNYEDWNDRVDINSKGSVKPQHNKPRTIKFKWQIDDDTSGALPSSNGIEVFDAVYQLPETFANGEKIYETQFFAKTISQRETSISDSTLGATANIPFIWPGNYLEDNSATTEREYDFKPRLLYFGKRRGGSDGYINMPGASNYDVPISWFSTSSSTDPKLAFAALFGGIVQRFHLRQITGIERGRFIKEAFYLDEIDILNFSFRDFVRYGRLNCIVNKINGYRPGVEGSTKVELIEDVAPTLADAAKIELNSNFGNIGI